ncbi:hypothetical protein BDV93DRAFT_610148 [Ceratobasidium sp. AG-I]|nr:hypothetical protein BDV93DRAFT_610148 [Ceratobasidium sp. AG-I]
MVLARRHGEALKLYKDIVQAGIGELTAGLTLVLLPPVEKPTPEVRGLRLFETYGLVPDVTTYRFRLTGLSTKGSLETATQILDETQSCAPNREYIHIVVLVAVRLNMPAVGLVTDAKESVGKMDEEVHLEVLMAAAATLNAEPTPYPWNFVSAGGSLPTEPLCIEPLHLQAAHVSLLKHYLAPFIGAYSAAGQINEVIDALEWFHQHNDPIHHHPRRRLLDPASFTHPVDIHAINTTLQAAVNLSDLPRAIGTYKELPDLECTPIAHTYDILLAGCLGASHSTLGERLFSEMTSHTIQPTLRTYTRLILLSSTQENYELAFEGLEEMKGQRMVPPVRVYDSLARRCVAAGDARAEMAFEDMKHCGYRVSVSLRRFVMGEAGGEEGEGICGPGTPPLAYKKVHYAQVSLPFLASLHHHNTSLPAKLETPEMEPDQHGSDSTEMTQSAHAENLTQGKDSVHAISPRPLHTTHTENPVEYEICSDSGQTAISAEMEAAHGDMTSKPSTNEFCLARDNLTWSNLSTHSVLRSPEGLTAVTDQTVNNTVTLDDSHAPRGGDKLVGLSYIYEHFQSSKSGTDSDLLTLDMLILCLGNEEFLGDSNDIELAIKLAVKLATLGHLLLDRARFLNSVEDTDRAIECLTRAARVIRGIPTLYAKVSQALVTAFQWRHEKYGSAGDIDLAIEYQHQSVASAGDTHEDYATLIARLGSLYNLRFRALGSLSDIDKAIEYGNLASLLIPETGDARISILIELGYWHRLRFERLGELGDSNKAIDCQTRAFQLTPQGSPSIPGQLISLCYSHICRFERLGKLEDINRAIDYVNSAYRLTPVAHPGMLNLLYSLGSLYSFRFESLGELEDINKAIDCQTSAYRLIPEGHPDMPSLLNNLGESYIRRFERLSELHDIDKAIDCQTSACRLTPEGHPDMPVRLNILGISCVHRFNRLGELEDINKAIDCQTSACRHTPEDHPDMPSLLNNLGNSYMRRFQRLGELEDMNKAIESQTSAYRLTPEDHPHMPGRLNDLGNSYVRRFERLGELEDMNKAIDCQTSAYRLTPEGHPDMPVRLDSLGISCMRRFERLGELEDMNKAIDCQASACRLTPEGHPDMSIRFNNLGNSYACRFTRLGELVDIKKAIKYQTNASRLTPEGHPDLPGRLNNLGISYMARFQQLLQPEDNEEAIECFTHALRLLPYNHNLTPIIQNVLGRSYRAGASCFEGTDDILKAVGCWEAAARSSAGSPAMRLMASCHWAEHISRFGLSASLPAYRVCMQLLPEAIWLGMTSRRRYERITEIGAVAVKAAAAAISAKEYSLALEWLEAGRSIVWNQTLQLRTPFDTLATVDSALAQKLQQVARDLELANKRILDTSPIGVHTMSTEHATLQHHRLVGEYNQLINQARDLPDFHNFMCPKTAADLVPAARSGPVVIVNVHKDRCNALILSPLSDEVAHVPLLDLSQDSISHLHGLMIQTIRAKGIRERTMARLKDVHCDHFNLILSSLWHNLVKPILDFLGFSDKLPVDQLPRITWCTTGALSFLPIHAAGDYGSGQDRIFDYAITSYTPTLSALLTTTPQPPAKMSGLLAVSQESTLPGTKDELAYIKKHVTGLPHMQLENSQATPSAVLDAMEQYECVHLACHASQNTAAPTQSCFHLHGGTLSLDDIAQRSLKNKSLAFLSACQTAAGDQKMPDEAIHLAAGMLIAGYPSVIATMWSISDGDAPSVADEVYGQLVRDGKLDCSQVARALHVAAGALRASIGEDQFSRWVPYVHIGDDLRILSLLYKQVFWSQETDYPVLPEIASSLASVLSKSTTALNEGYSILASSTRPVDIYAINTTLQAAVSLSDLPRAIGIYNELSTTNAIPSYTPTISSSEDASAHPTPPSANVPSPKMTSHSIQPTLQTYTRLILLSLTQENYELAF